MKKIKLLIITIFIANCLQAQNVGDYATYDKQTYDAFLKKDWKNVIAVGQDAITEGVDYYFLRYRMGVAFYELKHYRAAIPHFEKALIFNEFDEVSKEFLYYSYLFSERFSDAERVSKTFSTATKKKLDIKPPMFLTTVITEGGIKTPTFDSLKAMTFYSIGLGHRLGDKATAFHNFSSVSQTVYYGKISQKQYYLGLTVPLKKGLLVQPVFHLIDLNLASTNAYVNSFHRTDFLGSVQVTQQLTFLNMSVNASFSNLYGRSQTQLGAGVTIYPFNNNQLSLSINGTLQKDSVTSSTLFQVLACYRPIPQLELSAQYYAGGTTINVNEMNGFLVNNSYDVLKNRFGGMARYAATKHLSIYGLLQVENRTESYYLQAYQNLTLAAGLQFNF